MKVLATATFDDTYAGFVPAFVEAYKTKRRGQAVIRYRWTSHSTSTLNPIGDFMSVEGAVAFAKRAHCYSNVSIA